MKPWESQALKRAMWLLAILLTNSVDPFMNSWYIVPSLCFEIDRTLLTISDLAIADGLKGVVCAS